MPLQLIHFGSDDCHRLMVLERAGYAVVRCRSFLELRASVRLREDPGAILISDGEGISSHDVIGMIKAYSTAPVIFFGGRNGEDAPVDLVVENLTPPEVWLEEIDSLLANRARADASHRDSNELRRDVASPLRKFMVERRHGFGDGRPECSLPAKRPDLLPLD